ncbi:MAG: hypothetical protein QOE50_537 [Sphingomonadales bacterium]|jgi:hypothetical protein|nr:hypothetical protein [Sphingomonadales bacterium]
MILLALALAAQAQWTGPRTVEYRGPGNFCGGGYRVALTRGERALVLPQATGGQGARLVLSGGEVNIHSGVRPESGPVVIRYRGGTAVTQQSGGGGVDYTVADQTSFALRVTSSAFRGFKRDRWFFAKANFAEDSDQGARCLAAYSY